VLNQQTTPVNCRAALSTFAVLRHVSGTKVTRGLFREGVGFGQRRMKKEELAPERQRMHERWRDRWTGRRTAQSRSLLPACVGVPPMWEPAPPKPTSRSSKHSPDQNQHQERFALGFSLAVPPVRAGYSVAVIEYACACGTFCSNPVKCPKCGRKRQRGMKRIHVEPTPQSGTGKNR
jgi:hypothetical protein